MDIPSATVVPAPVPANLLFRRLDTIFGKPRRHASRLLVPVTNKETVPCIDGK